MTPVPPITGPLGTTPAPVSSLPSFYAGDRIVLRLPLAYAGTVVTPANSRLFFTLKTDQYHGDALYAAAWNEGITTTPNPAIIEVVIPASITAGLYAGSYSYAVTATDRLGSNPQTLITGAFRLLYSAGTAQPQVPYQS